MDYTDPTLNRYRYRLDPLDEEWIDSGSRPVANYTSVPPGRYVFRVAARNADGVWNEDGLAIPLGVQTPSYKTWWFRLALVLAALLLVSAFQAPDPLPDRPMTWEMRRDIYLPFKEALNNVIKHSEASSVEIEVAYDAPFLALRLTDDGKGLDRGVSAGGHGVGLMRTHAERFGGGDPVTSQPGVGTTVRTRVRVG